MRKKGLNIMGEVEEGNVLAVYPDKCAGCMACAEICSLIKEGEIKPTSSRIKIVRREWSGQYLQVVCQQCDPPVCRSSCPSNAISRDAKTGAIHTGKNSVFICDLCGGEPKCIEWCPHEALKYSHLGLSERRKIMDDVLELKKATGYKPKVDVK